MNKIEEFLEHYASQYYDPVKAHEYYLKNRELKGRRKTSGMSDEQKKAWDYTKDNVTSEKKSKISSERDVKEQKIDAFRNRAADTRKRISEKLKNIKEKLTKKAAKERERIDKKKQSEIDSLEPIPKNISPERRARLLEKRKKEIADIREDAKDDKTDVGQNTKKDKVKAGVSASDEREQTRVALKSAIQGAREAFNAAKTGLNETYEKVYQNEYDKILSTIKGKTKSKGRKK